MDAKRGLVAALLVLVLAEDHLASAYDENPKLSLVVAIFNLQEAVLQPLMQECAKQGNLNASVCVEAETVFDLVIALYESANREIQEHNNHIEQLIDCIKNRTAWLEQGAFGVLVVVLAIIWGVTLIYYFLYQL